jgi:hypothetical protein
MSADWDRATLEPKIAECRAKIGELRKELGQRTLELSGLEAQLQMAAHVESAKAREAALASKPPKPARNGKGAK